MSTTTRRLTRIGAGVAALVGLTLAGPGTAQAATGFDPGAADARVAGNDRYATAAAAAQQGWTTADTVIIANGETNGIDALSAAYLAGVEDAPILLTRRDAVPQSTVDAIAKLDPTTVIVVGGESSVSSSTFTALTRNRTAQRIAGVDRYETSAKLVREGLSASTNSAQAQVQARPSQVILARGDVYGDTIAADALAVSPVAFRAQVPVVLTLPNSIPSVSLDLIGTIAPTQIYAVGSERAVSSAVLSELATTLNLSGDATIRISGADRTETAAAIANSDLATQSGFGKTIVGIANGYSVDALAAGPLAGKVGYNLLLTESATSLGSGTTRFLAQHKATLTTAKVFGGTNSVSATATDAARSSAGGTVTTPPVTTPPVTTPPVDPNPPVENNPDPQPPAQSGVIAAVNVQGTSTVVAQSQIAPNETRFVPQIQRVDDVYGTNWATPDYEMALDGRSFSFPQPSQEGYYRVRILQQGEEETVVGVMAFDAVGTGAPDARVAREGSVVTVTSAQPLDGAELVVREVDVFANTSDIVNLSTRSGTGVGDSVSFTVPVDGGRYTYQVALRSSGQTTSFGPAAGPRVDIPSAYPTVFPSDVVFSAVRAGDESVVLLLSRYIDGLTGSDFTIRSADGTPSGAVLAETPDEPQFESGYAVIRFDLSSGTLDEGDTITLAAQAGALFGSAVPAPHETRTTTVRKALPVPALQLSQGPSGRVELSASNLPVGGQMYITETTNPSDFGSLVGRGSLVGNLGTRHYDASDRDAVVFDAPYEPGMYSYKVFFVDARGSITSATETATPTVEVTDGGPTVATVSVDVLATDFPVNANPAATFDAPLAVTSGARLTASVDGSPVAVPVDVRIDGGSLTVEPRADLLPETTYTIAFYARGLDGKITAVTRDFTTA